MRVFYGRTTNATGETRDGGTGIGLKLIIIAGSDYRMRIIIFLIAGTVALNLARAGEALNGWMPSKDCALILRDGEFVISSSGNDPYLVATDASELEKGTGPFTVELLMASTSKGPAQIFWAPRENKHGFGVKQLTTFHVLHDGEWHDYSVKIDAPTMGGLRIDPGTAPGEIRLASVRVKGADGAPVKEWVPGKGGPAKEFPNANGNAQVRGKFKDSEIVITTTQRLAGAIHSLTWNGREFIDSFDHGRQLQSATNYDCGTKMTGETYNPTEAGSRADGVGPYSTSRLLSISAEGAELKTKIQMAFWLRPGEKSGGNLAKNTTDLSNHPVAKRVHIGHGDLANVIEYDVTFTIPNEHHTAVAIEAVTGYMPPVFCNFYTFDNVTAEVKPVADGVGEQPKPLIFATESGSHAMGIYAPLHQPGREEKANYGRFRFVHDKVVKWNCVYRMRDANGLKPGDYSYRMYVVVGNFEDVKGAMASLARTEP